MCVLYLPHAHSCSRSLLHLLLEIWYLWQRCGFGRRTPDWFYSQSNVCYQPSPSTTCWPPLCLGLGTSYISDHNNLVAEWNYSPMVSSPLWGRQACLRLKVSVTAYLYIVELFSMLSDYWIFIILNSFYLLFLNQCVPFWIHVISNSSPMSYSLHFFLPEWSILRLTSKDNRVCSFCISRKKSPVEILHIRKLGPANRSYDLLRCLWYLLSDLSFLQSRFECIMLLVRLFPSYKNRFE